MIESHEDFIQHIETGRAKIRILSIITIAVALLLLASYFSQLILPFISATRYVRIDLLNPALIATQVVLMILVAAWLYVGVLNYLFSTRLGRAIQKAREIEGELEKKIFQ
jgi:hypothetical protein